MHLCILQFEWLRSRLGVTHYVEYIHLLTTLSGTPVQSNVI